jgi:hypothetical protein
MIPDFSRLFGASSLAQQGGDKTTCPEDWESTITLLASGLIYLTY